MPEFTVEDDRLVHAVAQRIVKAGLAHDDSLMTPGQPVWTAGNAEELYRQFVLRPMVGGGSFLGKLRQQLSGSPGDAIQLAAELMYLHLMVQRDMKGATKQRLVQAVLDMRPASVLLPEELAAALEPGLANGGVAMKTLRWRQLAWLIEFVRAWKALGAEERHQALADPWAFKQAVFAVRSARPTPNATPCCIWRSPTASSRSSAATTSAPSPKRSPTGSIRPRAISTGTCWPSTAPWRPNSGHR